MAKASILVMDDEELIRRVAGKMLEFLGYQATLACDGEEALEIYRSRAAAGRPFDAVILDWRVPGSLDGVATMRKLSQIDPRAKGILSSGYAEQEQQASGTAAGFAAVIGKPYELKTLQAVVERVLASAPGA